MWSPSLLLLLLLLFSLSTAVLSQPPRLRGFLLDCGATVPSTTDDGLPWLPDAPYISSGVPRNLSIPGVLPILSTLRSFPFRPSDGPRKFCYAVQVVRRAKYLVRTTYFYGGFDGRDSPAVFDQIVDGTLWTTVNTTADYAMNMSSYYEGVFMTKGKFMSVCVAGNVFTDSDMFISSLEVILLEDSVYNSTDFTNYALGLIARSNFGSTGPVVRYPDDRFDRYWQPFTDSTNATSSTHNISGSSFWNLPPENVFNTALMADQDKPMELQWPPVPLPNSSYYIALYFADPKLESSRMFNVFVNDISFYSNLMVASSGCSVFATQWNLSGPTKITMTAGSTLPPIINAGEVFGIFPIGRITITRDVTALESVKRSIRNPPLDWNGDPCLPREYSWTGVTCSEGSKNVRVVTLNLSSMALSGSLSPSIANLTALTDISFGNNNLSGPIPDLGRLRRLERLHLQDNQFIGMIPKSLGNLDSLHELFLQNNNLTGEVPNSLLRKDGLNFKFSPGNHFSPFPPNSSR